MALVVADGRVLMPSSGRRMWVALRARLAAGRLDRQLADGVNPEVSDVMFAHASRIVSPSSCASLAGSVRRVVSIAETSQGVSNRAPLQRVEIISAREELLELADRLEEPRPLRAQGVAQIRVLLGDGSGPLYRVGARGSRQLRTDIRTASEGLSRAVCSEGAVAECPRWSRWCRRRSPKK